MALSEVAAWMPELEPWTGSLKLRIDHRLLSPRDSERSRVRCWRRREERAAVASALAPYEPPDIIGKRHGALVVSFTRHAYHPLDDDALAYTFKSFRDQVAAWAGVRDGPRDPIVWRYDQKPYSHREDNPRYGRPRQGKTRWGIFITLDIKGPFPVGVRKD